MITVKLWGGLGNQMFQYAYGYQLSKKTGGQLVLDVSWFSTQKLRKPEILDMNIEYDRVEETWNQSTGIRWANKKIHNILLRIPEFKVYRIGEYNYLKEARYHYLSQIRDYCKGDTYVDGYWQCPRYFDDIREDLIVMFTPKELSDEVKLISRELMDHNTCAVHVRRGDYRKKRRIYSRLQAIGVQYYEAALKRPIEKDCELYVFSNGPKEAKELVESITGKSTICLADTLQINALEEWYLMRACQNQVIGNSTFSWWAAYLNNYKEKLVCAPNKYMGNDDIIPQAWLTFPVE